MVNVPVPSNDIGAETQRSMDRILTLRFRIIVVHAEQEIARLMMSVAQKAGILDGSVSFVCISVFCCDGAHGCCSLFTCSVRRSSAFVYWHFGLDVRFGHRSGGVQQKRKNVLAGCGGHFGTVFALYFCSHARGVALTAWLWTVSKRPAPSAADYKSFMKRLSTLTPTLYNQYHKDRLGVLTAPHRFLQTICTREISHLFFV